MNPAGNEKITAVLSQYADSRNFMARVELNRKFGTNPYRWTSWIFDQIKFPKNSRVLEIGCGNALLWRSNLNRIPEDACILLSDLSEGMLNDARNILADTVNIFKYEVMDAQEVPYPDNSFDIVIANFMLYHVPDREKAISEVSRVLKKGGKFYVTAFSLENMKEVTDLVFNFNNKVYTPLQSLASAFGLENGKKQLNEYFDDVRVMKYENHLEVIEALPLVNFVLSSSNVILDNEIENFTDYIANIIENQGKIVITKDSGMFIAEKPK